MRNLDRRTRRPLQDRSIETAIALIERKGKASTTCASAQCSREIGPREWCDRWLTLRPYPWLDWSEPVSG
jgi:hypothetical protein